MRQRVDPPRSVASPGIPAELRNVGEKCTYDMLLAWILVANLNNEKSLEVRVLACEFVCFTFGKQIAL